MKFPQKMSQLFSWKRIMFFWYKYYKVMFFFGFLVVFVIGGYVWNAYLNQYRWSEETKKEFLEKHFKETAFKEKAFDTLITRLEVRAKKHGEKVPLSRDFFSGANIGSRSDN